MQRAPRIQRTISCVVVAAVLGTGAHSVASASEPPADATMFRLAATPGWEWLVEPLINALASNTDEAPQIEIDFEWQDAHAGVDVERDIVEAVGSGELDLGFVGTRALSDLGAPSFDALTAPMLVDSYPLQQAIMDSDIPDRLMVSLDDIGVTGLDVAAGPLRRPLGVSGPFLNPADFVGTTFHTVRSGTNAATVAALGATHTDVWGSERDDGLVDGTIDGAENSTDWMLNNGRAPYATLNVALWPATGVLIANPDLIAQLSDAEAQTLRDSAAGSLASATELADADASLILQVCSLGGRFAEASDDDIAALREAVEPVYTELASDADTAALIAEIEALKATVSDESLSIPEGCTGAAATPEAVELEAGDDPSVLNGSYQLEWTAEELVEASGGDITERDARKNAGHFVLTFEDGTFGQVWSTPPATGSCPGTYTVTGNRVTMVASSDSAEWDCGRADLGRVIVDATWELTSDQLILSDFVLSDQPDVTWWFALYLSKPLTRIES
jgi:TRAP-type C4-dicarboxylate transport system substrate-binding protein